MQQSMSLPADIHQTEKTLAEAVKLVRQYNISPAKADEILAGLYLLTDKNRLKRRVCQFIFLTVLRNKPLIESAIAAFSKRRPKSDLSALLQCAAAEILDNPENSPKIVNTYVQFAKNSLSLGEAKFCNAVLRKFPSFFQDFKERALSFEKKAVLYGHPLFIAERWRRRFGEEAALSIMQRNQRPSKVYLRKCFSQGADEAFERNSDILSPVDAFEGFYALSRGGFERIAPLLKDGFAYIQDPSTGIAARMLSPKSGMKVLDLCAAPGGKGRLLADIMKENSLLPGAAPADESLIVSVDKGTRRMALLRDNFKRENIVKNIQVDCDIVNSSLAGALESAGAPLEYDAIFLDAPCSNSGVLGRRPDARFRLSESDFSACADIQLSMLNMAEKFLKDGGKIAYSTCSIDEVENEAVVERFLKLHPQFSARGSTFTGSEDSDGCGAFILERLT